ncbi:MAG: adenylyltransferase/cytidyltransferase family protein [Gammaproteobacteria bacterium]|nr:adenylyltransferase/cytidyltransferase family protein [Gammaproteobacteria bacterium]
MSVEFFEKYKYKIKSREELLDSVGLFPRTQKIIVCHGVFDVVHPGHVRHLAYAKTLADILVVTITADKHIKKGVYRPHIPQGLRALNLAAFEMVNYVLVDDDPTPLGILEFIKPDYFAKGFEYSSSGLPPATQEEAELVKSYGGQMIFTPGDVVYSSSKFLSQSLPNLQLEKLLHLMSSRNITFDGLRSILQNTQKFHVHVIGDTIVDTYTRTNFIGGQTKTPTFSVLYQSHEDYIGGAGIVAQHLRTAGARVSFSTVLGNDRLKDFVVDGLQAAGIETNFIVDPTRPTVNKNVIIAGGYRLLKLDTLDNRSISKDVQDQLADSIRTTGANAVVFSDFRHGIFNRITIPGLRNAIPDDVFKVADSQVASRWGNITEFKNFDLITPNEREARFAIADQDSSIGRLSSLLKDSCDYRNLILKLGDKGVFCSSSESYFSVDSFANNVIDAVGAGDALLAYATLALMGSGCIVTAAILGSMAGACECEYDGNIPVKTEMVLAKIDSVEKMVGYQIRES